VADGGERVRIQEIEYAELAERFGTPLYVYDGDKLARRFTELQELSHPRLEIFFSLKSNPNISVFSLLHSYGARAEVSSLVELRTALAAGAAGEEIIFLGPGKSDAELTACVDGGVYAIVCESFDELERIERLAGERGVRQRVMLRINPAYSVNGSRLTMGGKPRQFGIDEAAVLTAKETLAELTNTEVIGVHVYSGTRILDAEVIIKNTAYVLELAERVAQRTGIRLEAVDIGGGLGVAYFDGEEDLDPIALTKGLNPVLEAFTATHPGTRLIMESGRYLTAPAGVYMTSIRSVKQSMGEWFAVADGGTHHHMAAVGIGSFVKRNFPVRLLNRAPDGPDAALLPWTVTGPLCTPNDTLLKRAALPKLAVGDLLGVLQSGAYGPSASPGLFLSHGYPAEVLVHDGQAHLVRSRDEPEDVLRSQHLYATKGQKR
jgi:diaminopimelate decarboxylase